MSARGTYLATLVIFVAAAFFTGLVVGVNYGRSGYSLEEPGTPAVVEKPDGRDPGPAVSAGPEEYPAAPDFLLVETGTGETVEMKDFAGSHLLLFIGTTT